MTEILSINVNMFADEALFQKGMLLISEERKEKIKKFKTPMSARLSLGAGILLMIALERYGLQEKLDEIKEGKHGKPFLEGENFHFSLSHSGNYAICAFGDMPLGADIQQIKEKIPNQTNRILSNAEKEYLSHLDERENRNAFFQIWTKKESLIKWDGRGVRLPMQEFSFIQKGTPLNELEFAEKKLYFQEYKEIFPNYAVCVCSENKFFPEKIEEITAEFLTIYEKTKKYIEKG